MVRMKDEAEFFPVNYLVYLFSSNWSIHKPFSLCSHYYPSHFETYPRARPLPLNFSLLAHSPYLFCSPFGNSAFSSIFLKLALRFLITTSLHWPLPHLYSVYSLQCFPLKKFAISLHRGLWWLPFISHIKTKLLIIWIIYHPSLSYEGLPTILYIQV